MLVALDFGNELALRTSYLIFKDQIGNFYAYSAYYCFFCHIFHGFSQIFLKIEGEIILIILICDKN